MTVAFVFKKFIKRNIKVGMPSKSIIFLVKSFLGNFYRHLAIFLVTLVKGSLNA